MIQELSPATTTRLVPVDQLSPADLARMFGLLHAHFDGVTIEQFQNDAWEKNWAILIERNDQLVGFSMMHVYETYFEGEPVSVVYSGDTIVDPTGWNSAALPRTWIESVAKLRKTYSQGRLIWLLLTSGFRTYRLLCAFWREFYPRYDLTTPGDWQRLMDHLAFERFGNRYDPACGIVRFEHPQRLRDGLAQVPPGREMDPHVAFFAARNPAHAAGDELVCITELTPGNLTPAGRRMAASVQQW